MRKMYANYFLRLRMHFSRHLNYSQMSGCSRLHICNVRIICNIEQLMNILIYLICSFLFSDLSWKISSFLLCSLLSLKLSIWLPICSYSILLCTKHRNLFYIEIAFPKLIVFYVQRYNWMHCKPIKNKIVVLIFRP